MNLAVFAFLLTCSFSRAWALTLAIAVSACASASDRAALSRADRSPPAGVAYVVSRGWHTDIALPADEAGAAFPTIRQDFPGVRTLVFGFGERAYLLSRRRDFVEMVRALLPGPSAVLVTALRTAPKEAFGSGNVVELALTREQLDRLTGFIKRTLATDGTGLPHPIAPGPYLGSQFYAAQPTYDALYTCNTWTAEALKHAGLPVSATGVLFASQVLDQVKQVSPMSIPAEPRAAPLLRAAAE
jgi:uncharacterized protein (TIGR02117 family)